jgi:hypothetical protein
LNREDLWKEFRPQRESALCNTEDDWACVISSTHITGKLRAVLDIYANESRNRLNVVDEGCGR